MSYYHYQAAQNYDYCQTDYDLAGAEVKMWAILKKHVIAGTYDAANADKITKEIIALDWPWLDTDFKISGDIDLIEDDIDCLFSGYEDSDCQWDERKAAQDSFWAVMTEDELLEAAE